MINIHLCNDEKFINIAQERFETYFPDCNVFIINRASNRNLNYVTFSSKIKCFDFKKNEVIEYISSISNGKEEINIFVHFLDNYKVGLVNKLRNKVNFKDYWIFYGADLYNLLHRKGKYELYDRIGNTFNSKIQRLLRGWYFSLGHFSRDNEIKRFIRNLDYFCFWNYYDFKLLKDNFKTNAKFKKFNYGATHDLTSFFNGFKKESKVILVNNSGSASGNHLTMLESLNKNEIKASFSSLILPLNYGSKKVIQEVDAYCNENFKTHYKPLLSFIEKNEYFNLIKNVDVVFFGHLRQEGAGNINFLLAMGAKIFLRKQNNLLKYYRDLGLILFSWEEDFKRVEDLKPLSILQQRKNREIILEQLSPESFNTIYSNLLQEE